MDRRIGRAADRRIDDDAVLKSLSRQDVGRFQVLPDHPDDALAGLVGNLAALAVRRGDRGAARQRHAQGLGQRIHGGGGSHGIAMADRGRRRRHDIHELLVVDLACGELLARFPDHGSGTGTLTIVPAVQHRSAGQHDGRQIDGCRRHQAGGSGLVAACGQDHTVEGVAEQDLDQPKIGEVAVKRRGRALAGFLDRVHRKFHRDAAGSADSLPDPVCQFEMVAVARRQVVACLRDADDRLAGLQLLPGQAVIEVALKVERGHSGVVGVVKPLAGTEFAPGDAG
ncbi:hypothetical protein GALL_497440 [mine drainage metagenome]|uniref:Uncharacterized protein n=1 Tax=mine drainage metagenome TaxID=410659 RepID=A0A1J5PBG6_9ZZZZ